MMRRKSIDLNGLLTGANLLVMGLIVFGSRLMEGNEYVDRETLVLGVLLCSQTQIALWLERRRRDPFILLLAFQMIFYYALRIFTLTVYPFSLVFGRYGYDVDDTNYALIFIVIANVFLYLGLCDVRLGSDSGINSSGWRATAPGRVVALMLVTLLLGYLSIAHGAANELPRVLSFLVLLVQDNVIVLMALSYYLLFRKSLSRRIVLTIATLIGADLLVHTLFGSRSAIVEFVQTLMLVMLAIAGCIKLSRRLVVLGLLLSPIVVVLLVGSFAIATYNRASKEFGAPLDVGRALQLAGEESAGLSGSRSLDVVLASAFARAGFLDFSAEIIAHRKEYSTLINVPAYARSIIDNVLTPGFDVYDQPKIANGLQYIYRESGRPSKEELESDSYQSDQLGVYGEFYALFGYACLPLLFLVARLLKWTYARVRSGNPFVLATKRVIVLFVFFELLRSFGIDWIIAETVPLIIAVFIYEPFFSARPLTGAQPRLSPASPAAIGPDIASC